MKLTKAVKDYFFKELKYGYLFKKRLSKIESYNRLSSLQLEELEAHLLSTIVKNAYKKSNFYKQLYNDYGVNINQIQSKDDLNKLPLITKDIIKTRVDDIYIGNSLKHTSYTSGTSGSPLKVYYSLNCILNEACYNEVFRNKAGHYYGDRVVSLRGALDGSRKEYYDKYCNILYLSSYHINPKNANWYYSKIREFNPKTILAYPSSLEALTNIFINKGLKIKIPIAFTSSETLYPHQQAKIEAGLNTEIYDRYGNAERTISLVQYEHNSPYTFPKLYSINEFIKKGEIITTSLINNQFPLIRYQVNDVIEFNDKNEVDQIGGRIDDCIISEDGLVIGSAAMSLAFKKVSHIMLSQIIQDTIEEIKVRIVVNELFTKRNEEVLYREIKKRVGNSIKIDIIIVDEKEIQKTDKNKYKLIISSVYKDEKTQVVL